MKRIFTFALITLFFASCQNSTEEETMDEVSTSTEMTTLPDANAPVLNPVGDENAAPATATPAPANSPDLAALNPEHGLPGHRCDIPVGAPLTSPAGANPNAATTINSAPATMQNQPAPAPAPVMAQPATGSNQRLNPPHGQPGHDCAVAVGAPLNG